MSDLINPPDVAQLKEALSTVAPEKERGLMQSFAETWLEEGRKEGREEGLQQGAATLVLRQIHHRFGILEVETSDRIRALPLEKLEQLGEALLHFTSRDDLTAWLLEHSTEGA